MRTPTPAHTATLLLTLLLALVATLLPATPAAAASSDYEQVVDLTFPFRTGTAVRYGNDYDAGRSGGRHHQSTDLMVAGGTPVYAATTGHVRWVSGSEDGPPSYGWMVKVRGDDGREYAYLHLGWQDRPMSRAYAPGIERGARVYRGQLLGWAGCSGSASCGGGEHLHFEIHDDDVVDPYDHHDHERINPYYSLRAAERRGDYADPRFAGPISDVNVASVHYANIEALMASGVSRGCNPPTNDRFCPDRPVTRAQMATFLQRLARLDGERARSVDAPFRDTARSAHEPAIGWLASAGITRGCNPPANTMFCPDRAVTRAQMATFLTRALELPRAGDVTFTDARRSVHADAIARLAKAGITKGCNPPANTMFCPDRPVTRAQMATFLVRTGLVGR